jgi:hypothetical protein
MAPVSKRIVCKMISSLERGIRGGTGARRHDLIDETPEFFWESGNDELEAWCVQSTMDHEPT